MLFLLDYEKEYDFITQDTLIYKQQLDKRKEFDSYVIVSAGDFFLPDGISLKDKCDFPSSYQSAIPIGSIQFINAYLNIFFSISREKAIEIPRFMQTDFFLKRQYSIMRGQNLPRKGLFFLKDVSIQRSFSFTGKIEKLREELPSAIIPDHNYLLSEVLIVLSEFRVYVIDLSIKNISHYSGNPTILPDIELIRKAVECYGNHVECPKSFSMDFMVTPRGTCLIEIHSFLSLGMYWTKWDTSLIDGYVESYQHVLNSHMKSQGFFLS